MTPIVARWQDGFGDGIQHLVLRRDGEGFDAEAVIVATEDGARRGARLHIVCDGAWRTRRVQAALVGDDYHVDLSGDGAGRWRDASGPLPHLDGAIDVDLPLTPFTNTLPIRRLDLAAGASADLAVVYIRLVERKVERDPQRYTCLEPMRRYRYQSLDSDFMREIDVDADGLVVTYPDLFRRVL
jgi:hypothetical protein